MSKDAESTAVAESDAVRETQPPQLMTLARAAIVRSRTNPRGHFDEAYIKDLAASIREHGVLQPILVRPLPGDRLQDTHEDRQPGDPLPTHELVCGECRWRAAGLVGVEQLPVLMRHLDDVQVLQIQLVENLKRRDLHPLEEADGFDRLIREHGLSVDDVADRVGKSASYVFKLRKLLELTPECREILYQGKLTQSTATLVARAPAYLQQQIAQDIMDGGDGEPMSYRRALDHIHRRYMLRLADAVFDIKDASLVAKAGACTACSKNTGSATDLFDDVQKDHACTDPKCFDAKKVAHMDAIARQAKEQGKQVIAGKEAKELYRDEYSEPTGYTRLDASKHIAGKYQPLRKALGKDLPATTLIQNPFTKQLEEVLPIDVASKLLKKADAQFKAKASLDQKNAEPSPDDLEEQLERRFEERAITRIHAAIMEGRSPGITVRLARAIAQNLLEHTYDEADKRFARLFGLQGAKVATSAGIKDWLRTCKDNQVGPALLVLLIEQTWANMNYDDAPWSSELLAVIAEDAGMTVKAIKAEVQEEMKTEAAERKAKAAKAAATAPAPKAKPKKTTAAEAKAGISAALKSTAPITFQIGDRVRFKDGLRGPNNHFRKVSGREGTIDRVQPEGDEPSYGVRYGDKGSDYASARWHELELLQPVEAMGAKKTAAGNAKASGNVCPPAIGCRVRVNRTGHKHVGRTGRLGPFFGDTWHVTFEADGCATTNESATGRVKQADFIVIEAAAAASSAAAVKSIATKPATKKKKSTNSADDDAIPLKGGKTLDPAAAWPFPTAHKP